MRTLWQRERLRKSPIHALGLRKGSKRRSEPGPDLKPVWKWTASKRPKMQKPDESDDTSSSGGVLACIRDAPSLMDELYPELARLQSESEKPQYRRCGWEELPFVGAPL